MDTRTRRLHSGIEGVLREHPSHLVPEGSLPVGWLLVAEWLAPDGERELTFHQPTDSPRWVAKGYCWAYLTETGGVEETESESD